jgi:DNA-binding transcriptional ArsR family regulator
VRLPDEPDVFRALADPQRRLLLDRLNVRDGQTLRELCAGVDLTRQAVSKHLAVLEAANLVTAVRRGREKFHHLNAAPITEIADRWIRPYHRARAEALADLKHALEEPMFVYTSYVRTTPERLFAALTEPAFTRRYWQSAFETGWMPGAPMTWHINGAAVAHPEQVVLEYEPPRRLAYTWHTFTPEWAAAVGVDEEVRARLAAERRSRVRFELEPDGPVVKLTVVHDDLEPDGLLGTMIRGGWPRIVADLKTLLETGALGEDGAGASVR